MFSEDVVKKIKALAFDPQAERLVSFLPLGSIFWVDELPKLRFHSFNEGTDRDLVLRLFSIRINYWNTGSMTPSDQALFANAQQKFPEWPFFRRLHLTAEERLAHEEAQRCSEKLWAELFADANEIAVTEKEGFESFSLTYKVDEESGGSL